jgi:hypothetical protein
MKIVEEDVTTYQECLGSYLKKIFQRSMQRLWNADERTLLHPSNPPEPKHPQKKHSICKTVTTIPPPARGAATSKHPQLSVLPWNQGKKTASPPARCPMSRARRLLKASRRKWHQPFVPPRCTTHGHEATQTWLGEKSRHEDFIKKSDPKPTISWGNQHPKKHPSTKHFRVVYQAFDTYTWVNYSNSQTWNKVVGINKPNKFLTTITVRENSEVVISYNML